MTEVEERYPGGLDERAEQVYLLLLAEPGIGADRLARRLAAAPEEIDRVLGVLRELSLVRVSGERPGRFHPVGPGQGLETLLARQAAELAAWHERVVWSRAAAARLIAEYSVSGGPGGPNVKVLTGAGAIHRCLVQSARGVRTEALLLLPHGTGVVPCPGERSAYEVLEHGARLRVVVPDEPPPGDESGQGPAHRIAERGGLIRTAPAAALPVRMALFDGGTAVLPASGTHFGDEALVVTGDGVLAALYALFESVWRSAVPLDAAADPDPDGLSEQDRTVLTLLAAGYTDETVAKRLRVSHRTARRLATRLMERLGARSRFEAGVRAARRGWIE
ncbi:helix-turn-helix transcriptional regulator [Streptomyces sp. NPDC020875]|uniref:helix-turn-helix transcriptional regulator n=1 Tax=Streptomyces sp. NPDC020875 TaxID=3154898 RepID=UPI0033D24EE6